MIEAVAQILTTGKGLNDSIKRSFRAGHASIKRLNKKKILTFDDGLDKYFRVDYSERDLVALQNFRVEAFTVAYVGDYELQEKLKQLAIEIQKEDSTTDPFKEFDRRAREITKQYVWNDGKEPPEGWLKTNLQTAVSSSYRASEWLGATDPTLGGLYTYGRYMTVDDDKVRPEHRLLHGKVFLLTDPIWDIIAPPNGWNCRCYIIYLTKEEVTPEELTQLSPEQRKDLLKKANVSSDFQRNSGTTNSIWNKWLDSKLHEMDLDKVVSSMQEYADSHKALSNFSLTEEELMSVRNALASGKLLKATDYDNNTFLVNEDQQIRRLISPLFKDPHEVWGRSLNTNHGKDSELYYIKYTKKGIAVAIVKNGKVTEITQLTSAQAEKYRRGFLIHKNFS